MKPGRRSNIAFCLILSSVLSTALLSCNRDNPAFNRENIKATWRVVSIDGVSLSERETYFMTFNDAGIVSYQGVSTLDTAGYTWGDSRLFYEVYCCDLSINGNMSGLFGYTVPVTIQSVYDFVSHEDSTMVITPVTYTVNGNIADPGFNTLELVKLSSTYSATDSISGIWQFNTLNGQEFNNYRLNIQSSGRLTFYTRVGENEWEVIGTEDTYRKYDGFLAMSLYDNSLFGTSGHWDVCCFNIESVSKTTTQTMTLTQGEDRYVLSFLSAN